MHSTAVAHLDFLAIGVKLVSTVLGQLPYDDLIRLRRAQRKLQTSKEIGTTFGRTGVSYDCSRWYSRQPLISPKMHLVPPPLPPEMLQKHCFFFFLNFSWNDCNTQEKCKTKVMQNMRGQTKCILGDLQMAN